ncbi:MAG: hypothetical protein RL347_2258 [Actinomycetota bacterium]|jgi:hypothetical protein
MSDPVVIIVRHAEKPEPEGPHGVDHHGHPSGHGLTPRGWSRSGALAARMAYAGRPDDALVKPQRVYATATDPHHASDRPRLTAHGIAKRLDLDMLDHFGRGDEAKLAAEVLSADQHTLVVWDHGHIPTLARAFPLQPGVAVPDSWPDDRFDLYWVLTPGQQGYSLQVLPQELLAGDAPTA